MNIFSNRRITFSLKLYVVAALIAAAIFSDPVSSVAAVLVLSAFLFVQWRKLPAFTGLLSAYFVFFAIAILTAPFTNFVVSTILSLPILFLLTGSLINTAKFLPVKITNRTRSISPLGIMLPFIALVNLLLGLLFGNTALVLTSTIAIIYLAALIYISTSKLSGQIVTAEQIQERIVAGTTSDLQITLHPKTSFGGLLSLETPYDWLKIHTPALILNQETMILKLTLSPQLSGPSVVEIPAYASDIWGLTQIKFMLFPVQLNIIPRARYAAWLAKKYLETSKQGMLPLISNVSTVKPRYGLRRGVEYYGSQLYQAGDELKSIDWKHSAKYNKMITKEFIEFSGQPAILLVNLAVSNAEEADEMNYNTIMAALSLAREQIPTVVAAYDQNGVKLVTQSLQPQQLVTQSLAITRNIKLFDNPAKYLYSPDIIRLRANIGRLKFVGSDSARGLSELMDIEYRHLMDGIAAHPATRALNKARDNANVQSTIVVVSKLNHDANTIEAHRYLLSRQGNAMVMV